MTAQPTTPPQRRVVIAGAGGVLGQALCQDFSRDAEVIALRRPGAPEVQVAGVRTVTAPLADGEAVRAVLGPEARVDVLVHNAAHLRMAPFEDLTRGDFDACWEACVGTALAAVHAVLPSMLARGQGCLIFCGATASRRGGARFAAFASAKFALRGLAQSLARELQPRGIHVAHLVLDGLLAGSRSAERFGSDLPTEALLSPEAVANACRQLAAQERAAWTHELDLRPAAERF